MIKKYKLENIEKTYVRIWQKINLGKEVLEPGFFKVDKIEGTDDSYRLKVFQFDTNTRAIYLSNELYLITSEEGVYNYLDTGRAYTVHSKSYYHKDPDIIYFYNDLIVTDKEIEDFEDYRDKKEMSLKVLKNSIDIETFLVYGEDLIKIKDRMKAIREEEEAIERQEKVEEIKGNEEEEKLESLIRQYDKMTLLEDKDTIIKDNFFIDKEAGFKIEFKDKVVNIFEKNELINDRVSSGTFITISFSEFLRDLEQVYRVGKYEEAIAEKLKKVHKKSLSFKIYSYDPETKAEVFIKEVRIENITKNGKLRFKINGIKMPIQKMKSAIRYIKGGDWGSNKDTILTRLANLEDNLENIRLYSGTQLELLEGKTLEIKLNGMEIPINFNFTAEDKENWKVSIDNFSAKRTYKELKELSYSLRGGGLSAIAEICDTLKAGKNLEDILIGKIQGYVEKRRLAEHRAETLFAEFLDKNKTRVFKKDNGYIVKEKLKNYLVKMKNEEEEDNNVGVWTYPANEYVCINEKTKEGQKLCPADKLLQFCMVMLNDGNLRQEIHTIH